MALLTTIKAKARSYSILVMFQHSIFSFSFALVAMLIAADGIPSIPTLILLGIALFGARTGANAVNRVIDAEIDAKNPRTRHRQIPQGEMSKKEAILFSAICLLMTMIAAFFLNPLSFYLAPVALFFIILYSYTKTFTALCHLFLGFTCAMAPAGVWIAVTGKLSLIGVFLAGATMFWVAGFDIIYGAQDVAFDRENHLRSIPETFGIADGLIISRIFHGIAFFCLIVAGILTAEFQWLYFIGLSAIGLLLIMEHVVIKPSNLTHATFAAYNVNELISVIFLVVGILDFYL